MSTLHEEDCLNGVQKLPDNTIDLTVTSPPYNVGITGRKNPIKYNVYSDDKEQDEYINWLAELFHTVYEKTASGGRLAINIGDQKNGAIPTHVQLTTALTEIGWQPFSTII